MVRKKGVATLNSDPTVWYPYHSREEVPADQVDSFKSRYNTYDVQDYRRDQFVTPVLDAINTALNQNKQIITISVIKMVKLIILKL